MGAMVVMAAQVARRSWVVLAAPVVLPGRSLLPLSCLKPVRPDFMASNHYSDRTRLKLQVEDVMLFSLATAPPCLTEQNLVVSGGTLPL
jgi:hypothetical protein